MLTFKRIRFLLGVLVLPLIVLAQPGINTPGINISVPAQIYANQSFTVEYSVYHNLGSTVQFSVTAGCSRCSPGSGACSTFNVPDGMATTCSIVWNLDNVSSGTPVNFNGTAFYTDPNDGFPKTYSASTVTVNALPVELVTFNGLKKNNVVKLSWQTATELNNEAFMVEKSLDGAKFSTIGKVDGAGTTFETQNYNFVDENPGKGVAYYRLKQMDFDGSYEYSDVVSVVLDGRNDDAVVYPNPVSGMATLRFEEEPVGPVSVKVFNAVGLEVSRYEVDMLDGTELNFDVSILPVGTYFVKVEKDNTTSTTVLKKL